MGFGFSEQKTDHFVQGPLHKRQHKGEVPHRELEISLPVDISG